ncbi:trace amine-associated receptor 13c-like [Oreochromis niloticus]|uniref:trace amine-associated receptor 13c-like n=1 Tax=Oreochromis niloticus TaxID=8128 RepID=UPI0009059842|nr:trace amine-associated receptor 13c-like [Oreochromis niloticus]
MEIQMHLEAEFCFPELLNSSCRKPTLHWSKTVLLNVGLSFISVITAALNLLIIISVSHFRQLHTPSNILLLSLAVSDFFVGFLLMPVEIFRSTACWVFGDLMCSLYIYLSGILMNASFEIIVFISVDRYVAICDPLHYPTRITVARVKLSVFIIIIVLYTRVFVVAVSQARAMRSHVTAVTLERSLNQTNKSELKAARNLGVLVIVFLASICPFYFYSLVDGSVLNASSATFLIIVYFNSFLNPLIYTLFYPWFRNAVKLIITLQIFKHNSSEANIL